MRRETFVTAALMLLAMGSGPGGGIARAQASTDKVVAEPKEIHPDGQKQIQVLLEEKQSRTAVQKKIGSDLLYGRMNAATSAKGQAMAQSLAAKAPLPKLATNLDLDAKGRVLVDIKGTSSSELLGTIAKVGGEVVSVSDAHQAVRARVPLDQLEAVAGIPNVAHVRSAFGAKLQAARDPKLVKAGKFSPLDEQRAQLTRARDRSALKRKLQAFFATSAAGAPVATNAGSVSDEADSALGADRARKFYGVDGTGVRVGVLSDSNDFQEESIATGDLPPDTQAIIGLDGTIQDGRPGSGEGTAMMEIVHDIAPGAKLFFATAFSGPFTFADNIRLLRFVYGCDVIVDDIIYFAENPYQDDIIAQAVNDVTADGAIYASSAGNEGNQDDGFTGTWEGDFKDGGQLITLGSDYRVHDFGNHSISNLTLASSGPIILQWSDPGTFDVPQSCNDYDLFILDGSLRNVLAASTDIQDCNSFPFEGIDAFLSPGLRVVVAKFGASQTRALRLLYFGGALGTTTDGSTYGHNSAKNALGSAAVDVALGSTGGFPSGPTTQVEFFSSDGPRRVFYNADGTPIGGGVTFKSHGGENRKKPDITGPDGVSTTLPPETGLNPFFGTSAAAPHIAGVAALLKQAKPGATGDKIRNAMKNSAIDIEGPGTDRDSGAGVVSPFDALAAIGAKPAVFLELQSVAISEFGDGDGFIEPGESAGVNVVLVNNGGAGATKVTAKLTSSTPGVTITQGTSAYPNILPGSSAGNVTGFTFSLSPSAPCGVKVQLQLAVSFKGNGTSPTNLGFSVPTGAPSSSATNVAYTGGPVAIPDDDSVGVSIPLTVSGLSGVLSSVRFRIDGTVCSSDIGSTTVGLDHTWVGDLALKLTSPSGTTVLLMNRPGGTGNDGNNFCQTVLDDGAANSIQTIVDTDAPFTGSFKPASPLSAFAGQDPNGTWTLNVSDNAFLDIGTVRAFSLDVSGFSCGSGSVANVGGAARR